jgi:divalent metal cation (Fe/Co/Zn/Cd) transporter
METKSNVRSAIQRGRRLEYVTPGWNLGEAAVAIGAGVFAGSTALLGFGIDSLIGRLSGTVLLWRFATVTKASGDSNRLGNSLASAS